MFRDVRHAWRSIARMPVLAAVVIGSLGIGIGVNTVVFSWIQARLFKPLPGVAGSASFYWVESRTEAGLYPGVSWLEYRDLSERLGAFRALLAFRMVPFYVGAPGRTERVSGLLVSDNYFAALGVQPAAGRFPQPGDAADPSPESIVVISHDLWQTRFGGAADVLERTLRVNGRELTIAGVTPAGFQGTVLGLEFGIWIPARLAPVVLAGSRELDLRSVRGYAVMGKLMPGITVAQAQGEVDAAMREFAALYPATNTAMGGEVLPFSRSPRGPQRFMNTALLWLQAIMLVLLLAVCGNTANLVLARASARHREVGMRLALGSSPLRVVSLLLTETVMLGVCGALLGALFAVWGTEALRATPPMRGLPIRFQTNIDAVSLAFAMGLGILAGLLAGVVPAVHLARVQPQTALRSGAPATGRSRTRHILMAVQVAMALIVLVAAAAFVGSFLETRDTDPGFRREGVLLASYDLTGRPAGESASRAFAARVLERVGALPGVQAAAIAAAVPLDIHGLPQRFFEIEGRARADGALDQALTNTVTPGYFEVMGIPLVAGTGFAALDDQAAPPQVVVNEEFVRRYLGELPPLGRRVTSSGRSYTIAGVARNSLNNAFGEAPTAVLYLSYRDRPGASGHIHMSTRPGAESALASGIRDAVRDLDADVPVFNVRTMTEHVESNLIFRRVPARMFAVLGPLLLVLTSIGIYAVVAYTVSLRTADIGIRLALGAPGGRLIAQVVGQSLAVVGIGTAAGLAVATGLMLRFVPSRPLDPGVFVGVPAVVLITAAFASWLPARRASRIDPVQALRQAIP